ncbi:predicted protein [Uncinocarpus reesii 1704]|uniref:Uncharacterized protein n=1 Tax=Uncinocarpus reesii (strain UAMH 1704) TaxID=336963 RepID=C4JKZ3_UNCRE|nr:uncharacterized protein UREG_00181 [Uncinocarpus reesii 1704]EEP75335.1 predicted protein [Uncinocarpus reesii 1704]
MENKYDPSFSQLNREANSGLEQQSEIEIGFHLGRISRSQGKQSKQPRARRPGSTKVMLTVRPSTTKRLATHGSHQWPRRDLLNLYLARDPRELCFPLAWLNFGSIFSSNVVRSQ